MTERPSSIEKILDSAPYSPDLKKIAEKIFHKERISFDEGVLLYKKGETGFVGALANFIREEKHGDYTYFNKNFHIEPTNICVFDCKFCSYSRLLKQKDGAWEMSAEQMLDIVRSKKDSGATEVHIVGEIGRAHV